MTWGFSSLSESGFIPTSWRSERFWSFSRVVLISFREWLHSYLCWERWKLILDVLLFSSLSESGFIPTMGAFIFTILSHNIVLISFREWLHSYWIPSWVFICSKWAVLISFREWLHSYNFGFIGGDVWEVGVLISFREWLHSYEKRMENRFEILKIGSHLFQRVASFLRNQSVEDTLEEKTEFSSLSESGFIPTYVSHRKRVYPWVRSHLFQRVASFLPMDEFIKQRYSRFLVLISFREWLHSYSWKIRSCSWQW